MFDLIKHNGQAVKSKICAFSSLLASETATSYFHDTVSKLKENPTLFLS